MQAAFIIVLKITKFVDIIERFLFTLSGVQSVRILRWKGWLGISTHLGATKKSIHSCWTISSLNRVSALGGRQ